MTTWLQFYQPSHTSLDAIVEIAKRLDLDKDALALHAYNWDYLGSLPTNNTDDLLDLGYDHRYLACENKTGVTGKISPCGFDTHYPEFFPEKKGLDKYIKTFHDLGMRVVPYTNGHLFDP